MTKLTQRFFQSEADYAAMRTLLIAAGVDLVLRAYCTVGDLDWWRSIHADPDHVRSTPLWIVDGALAGFIWPSGNNADLLVHPTHREVEVVMLDWVEAQLAAADDEGRATVTTWAMAQDKERAARLTAHGYERTDNNMIFYTADLARSISEPALPPGFTIRPFAGETEIEARVAVHRSAFHPSRMTVEKHRRAMASPTYRQELDLLVIAPDGMPAAFCIIWYDEVNRFGVFEPVGAHQDYWRRGLAKAVLLHGQRLLRELGAEVAHVYAAGGNDASTALYPAAGFEVSDLNYQWEKQIEV